MLARVFWQWGGVTMLVGKPWRWRAGRARMSVEPDGSFVLRPSAASLLPGLQTFIASDLRVVELFPGYVAIYAPGGVWIASSMYNSLRRLCDELRLCGARVEQNISGAWVVPWLPLGALAFGACYWAGGSFWQYAFVALIFGFGPPGCALYLTLAGRET